MLEKLTQKQKDWIEQTYAAMSLDEKIGQMVNELGSYIRKQDDPAAWLKTYPIGSIFTGSEIIEANAADYRKTTYMQQVVDAAGLRVPILFSGDFENGIGGQIKGFSTMPRTMGVSATFSEKDCYDYGKVIGSEGRAINVRWGFGPVSDLNINRENPVTNIRSAGDDPDHAIMVLKNIVRGMQDCGCAACPKHFPGDGTDTRDQHLATSLNLLSKAEWDRMHGRVFKELIQCGAMSIMIGHIGFPAYESIDAERNLWRPATCSRHLLQDLLRGELGFDGIILSDALCMAGYRSWADYESRIIDSVNAGTDVLLWPGAERFFPLMKTALKDGRVRMETIEKAVRRILAFKALLGLMPEDLERESACNLPELLKENSVIAERIAEDSITLLRNRDNSIPLKLPKGARILAFLAPDAPEFPELQRNLKRFTGQLEKRGYEVTVAKRKDMDVLLNSLKTFDCIMYLANANPQYNKYRTVDGITWDLMGNEDVKKLIVISFGSPYHIYDMPSAPAYINAYHDCPASVDATVKALFGELPFRGKSPVTIPHYVKFGDGLSLQ